MAEQASAACDARHLILMNDVVNLRMARDGHLLPGQHGADAGQLSPPFNPRELIDRGADPEFSSQPSGDGAP
jgi:hypothetical protein